MRKRKRQWTVCLGSGNHRLHGYDLRDALHTHHVDEEVIPPTNAILSGYRVDTDMPYSVNWLPHVDLYRYWDIQYSLGLRYVGPNGRGGARWEWTNNK